MNLSEITIITRNVPPDVVEEPSENTKKLLSIILNSKVFNDFIQKYITDGEVKDINEIISKMNKRLWDSENYVMEYYAIEKEWRQFEIDQEIKELNDTYGFPKEFELDLYLLIKYKSFREMAEYPDIDFLISAVSTMVIAKGYFEKKKECVSFLINHQISKVEFIEWIKKNWDNHIKHHVKCLPVSPIIKTSFKDIEISSEIYNLHEQGNAPTKILEILSEKYINDIDIYDSLSLDFIKNKLRRFRNLLNKKTTTLHKTKMEYEYY